MNTENTVEMGGRDFRHLEITRRVVGVFFEVYGELGYGFLESVYRVAMTIALREAGITVEAEIELKAGFRGRSIGAFRADLLVEGVVVVELKAARGIDSGHIAQLLNYLRCTTLKRGSSSTLALDRRSDGSFSPTTARPPYITCRNDRVHPCLSVFICG